MSRFSYDGGDDIDPGPVNLAWPYLINRICRGKRGQQILRDLISSLLALPERRLIADYIREPKTGEVCALGALAKFKKPELLDKAGDGESDEEMTLWLGEQLGLKFMLSWEIGYMNDERCPAPRLIWRYDANGKRHEYMAEGYSPEERWQYIYDWACKRVRWDLPST